MHSINLEATCLPNSSTGCHINFCPIALSWGPGWIKELYFHTMTQSIGFDCRLDQILVLASKFVNIKIHILSCAPRQTLFKFFDCWIQKLTWPHSTCTVTVSCRARPWASQPNFHLDSLMVQTFYTMMLSSGINYRMNQILIHASRSLPSILLLNPWMILLFSQPIFRHFSNSSMCFQKFSA